MPEAASSNVEEVGMQDADVRIGRIENEVVPVYNPGLGSEISNTNIRERSLTRNPDATQIAEQLNQRQQQINDSVDGQIIDLPENQPAEDQTQDVENRVNIGREVIREAENAITAELRSAVLGANAPAEQQTEFDGKMRQVLTTLATELNWDNSQAPYKHFFLAITAEPPNQRVLDELQNTFGDIATRAIVEQMKSNTVQTNLYKIQRARETIYAIEQGGQLSALRRARRGRTAQERQQNIDQVFSQLAEQDEDFRKLVTQRNELNQAFIRVEVQQIQLQMQQAEQARAAEAARRAPALRVAAAVQLLEFGVSPDTLASLPPQGQAAVQSVVENGGARMMGALLSNGVSSDEGFVGNVAGQYVSLDYAEGELYLIGENAGDRANQLFYRIDPPTPAGFETVLIHSVGEQNRMPFIANHGPQAEMIWERLVGDPKDDGFPEEGNIDRFRNFLVLLIGEGSPDEAEEEARLRQLGIITRDAQTINRERVDLFVRALEKYVPSGLVLHEGDSPTTVSPESPSFNFQDALTLATLWDTDNRRLPEDLNELKELTEKRRSGEEITSRRFV